MRLSVIICLMKFTGIVVNTAVIEILENMTDMSTNSLQMQKTPINFRYHTCNYFIFS